VYTAPATIGRLTVYGKKKEDVVTVVDRSTRKGIGCHAAHCKSCGSSERVKVGEGEKLLMHSVRVHKEYDKKGDFEIQDVTPAGFTMKWKAKSYGCGPGWKGTRGQIRARVSYQVEVTKETVAELPSVRRLQ
jgi:hypothetical protein